MGRKTSDMQAIDRYVGQRIRWFRIERGWSQDDMARKLGISYQQLHKYETGNSTISAGRLSDIAKLLKVAVDRFFDGVENNELSSSMTQPTSKEPVLLARYYNKIKDPNHRKVLSILVNGLSNKTGTE